MAGLLVYNCSRKVEAGDRRVGAGFQSKSYNKVTIIIIQNFLNFMLGTANNNKHFHRTEDTRPD